MSTNSIEKQALELPGRERATLAKALLRSLEPGPAETVELAWVAEIKARLDEFERGAVELEEWDDVEARLLARVETKLK